MKKQQPKQERKDLLRWSKPEMRILKINFDTTSTKTFSSIDAAGQE